MKLKIPFIGNFYLTKPPIEVVIERQLREAEEQLLAAEAKADQARVDLAYAEATCHAYGKRIERLSEALLNSPISDRELVCLIGFQHTAKESEHG